jgi:hypothetical protein
MERVGEIRIPARGESFPVEVAHARDLALVSIDRRSDDVPLVQVDAGINMESS